MGIPKRLILLIVVCIGCSSFIAIQQSWKGMLVAEPASRGLPAAAVETNLLDLKSCSILIERLPDDIKDSVTKPDIETWVANRLTNTGIRVTSQDERRKALELADASTDEKKLAANDRFYAKIYVNINLRRLSSGLMYGSITVFCDRGVFIQPGYFAAATVWSGSMIVSFGASLEAKAVLRSSLNSILDDLEKDWKRTNR